MPTKYTPNDARVVNNIAYITLTDRKREVVGEAIVDLVDLPRVLLVGRWHHRAYDDGREYAAARVDGQTILLHRFLLSPPDEMMVDHRNHKGLDCRRKNLRICTASENAQNLRGPQKGSRSGVLNVYWNSQRACWMVMIRRDGKAIYLGKYNDLGEASIVAQRAREEYSPFLKT